MAEDRTKNFMGSLSLKERLASANKIQSGQGGFAPVEDEELATAAATKAQSTDESAEASKPRPQAAVARGGESRPSKPKKTATPKKPGRPRKRPENPFRFQVVGPMETKEQLLYLQHQANLYAKEQLSQNDVGLLALHALELVSTDQGLMREALKLMGWSLKPDDYAKRERDRRANLRAALKDTKTA